MKRDKVVQHIAENLPPAPPSFFSTLFPKRKSRKKKRTSWYILKRRGKEKFLKALTQAVVEYEKNSKCNTSPYLSKTIAHVYGCLQQTLYLKDSSIMRYVSLADLGKEGWTSNRHHCRRCYGKVIPLSSPVSLSSIKIKWHKFVSGN